MPCPVSSRAIVEVSVPLRPNSAAGPGRVKSGRDRAEQDLPGIAKPSVLGPTTHMSCARALASAGSESWIGTNSAATTANPMPASAHSTIASRTPAGGV